MENEEKFSDNSEEQLRIENELLKLKLQAELGAQFGDTKDLPPEIEQEFLKQVLAFHEQQQHTPLIKLKDYLDYGEAPLSVNIPEAERTKAWHDLEEALLGKRFQIIFDEEIPDTVRYDFVVNELFELDIMPPVQGANWIFDYEDFHPNAEKDMGRRTEEFMRGFFENNINAESWYLAKPFVTPAGKMLTIDELLDKIHRFHDLFSNIKSYDYYTEQTKIDEATDSATDTMGFVEGTVRYTITTSDGEEQEITGPFKLYFQQTVEWWEIFSFHVHGFLLD